MSEATPPPDDGLPLGPKHGDPYDEVITADRALLLAEHAVYVQGGFSTPQNEARRLRADMADGAAEPDWDDLRQQVEAARAAKAFGSDVEPGVVDLALVRRYKELRDAEKAAGAESKAMKEEADLLEEQIKDMFVEAGLQNMNVDGKTVYLHRATFAQRCEGIDAEAVMAALIETGGGAEDLITESVNSQTLSAFVREIIGDEENPKPLPPALVGVLELGEKYYVRVRAGSSRTKSKTTK